MRFVPTRVHAAMDYLSGVLLVLSPWLFGFGTRGPAQWVAVGVGVAVVAQSLLTDYELGLRNVLPMPAHLVLDVAIGAFLIASPWLFGFTAVAIWPHVVFGALAVVMSLITETRAGPPQAVPAGRM